LTAPNSASATSEGSAVLLDDDIVHQLGLALGREPHRDAVMRELAAGPFVSRYSTEEGVDGLAGTEGAFLICSFWLVNALAAVGRQDEARRNLDALLALQTDVGLLSEEYEPAAKRLLGNFPQAFSHIGLLSSILRLYEGFPGLKER
jgi:GH15 family glucan-1,4-alpha-glucosidase